MVLGSVLAVAAFQYLVLPRAASRAPQWMGSTVAGGVAGLILGATVVTTQMTMLGTAIFSILVGVGYGAVTGRTLVSLPRRSDP